MWLLECSLKESTIKDKPGLLGRKQENWRIIYRYRVEIEDRSMRIEGKRYVKTNLNKRHDYYSLIEKHQAEIFT